MNKRTAGITMLATISTMGATVLGANAATVETTTTGKVSAPVVATFKTPTTVADAQAQTNQAKQDQKTASSAAYDAKAKQSSTQKVQNSAASAKSEAAAKANAASAAASQAQVNKDQATPENIQVATSAASDAANEVSSAQSSVEQGQAAVSANSSSVSQAQTEVNNAANKLDVANQVESAAQVQVSQANQQVKDETDKLNNLTPEKINEEKDNTNKSISDDKTTINTTNNHLNNAKVEVANVTKDVSQKQDTANKTTNDLTNAKTNVSNATNANEKAQAAKQKAQQSVTTWQVKKGSQPTINVDVGAWHKVVADQSTGAQDYQAEYNAFVNKVLTDNKYTPSVDDTKTLISGFSTLTQDQRDNLMNFALDVINQALKLWTGSATNKFKSTRADMMISQNIADDYSAANNNIWNANSQHLVDKINEAHAKYDLGMTGENWGSTELLNYLNNGTLNLGNFKQALYQDIIAMMFADGDSDFGHMKNWCVQMPGRYVGLGFDKYGNTHFIIHDSFSADSGVDTTAIKHFEQSSDVEAGLAAANQDLSTKTAAATKTQDDLDAAQKASATAENANNSAQANLTNAQAKLAVKTDQVNTINKQLYTAKTQLARDQIKLEGLNQQLTNLAQARAKQTAIVEAAQTSANQAMTVLNDAKKATTVAKSALKTAQQHLTATKNDLMAATQALQAAHQDVVNKQQALTKAQGKLNDLVNADAKLAQAKADLQQAKAVLADKTAAYEKAVADNNAAKAQVTLANNTKKQADQAYTHAANVLAALKAKQNADKHKQSAQNNHNGTQTTPEVTQTKDLRELQHETQILHQKAEAARAYAQKNGRLEDKIAAQKATDRYYTALANLKIINANGTTKEANQLTLTTGSQTNVTMLDPTTSVIMPEPIHDKQKRQAAKLQYAGQKQLPQTGDNQNNRVGLFAGLVSLMTAFGCLGLKKRKQMR